MLRNAAERLRFWYSMQALVGQGLPKIRGSQWGVIMMMASLCAGEAFVSRHRVRRRHRPFVLERC